MTKQMSILIFFLFFSPGRLLKVVWSGEVLGKDLEKVSESKKREKCAYLFVNKIKFENRP